MCGVFRELEKMERIEKGTYEYDWSKNLYGLTREDFRLLFAEDEYNNYMDFHHYSDFDRNLNYKNYNKDTQRLAKAIKKLLNKYGYNNVALWITQSGIHTGLPTGMHNNLTEADQANALIRKYILCLSLGIEKIFWTSTHEFNWRNDPDGYFSRMGLIYNGMGENDPGHGIKKLAYYTYKLMVAKLDGSDWNNIDIVINGKNNIYAFKFIREGKPIWVVWWDYFEKNEGYQKGHLKKVSLKVGSDKVTVTSAIPDAEKGEKITSKVIFASAVHNVMSGSVDISLGTDPVYVEEGEVSAPVYNVIAAPDRLRIREGKEKKD